MRTRIKICGMKHADDAQYAVALGADAIGLIFYDKSPRYVSLTDARVIADSLPPFVSRVGLFVNPSDEQVREAMNAVPLTLLQFHGEESRQFCEQFDLPYIKALRMRENANIVAYAQEHPNATGLLLDTYQKGLAGGTGQQFDWGRIPDDIPLPVILAGGLNPENVADAINKVHPYAVDVSGGVELTPGIKDHAKMATFINEVLRVGTS